MDRDGILRALNAGEFDGISHRYRPVDGYGNNTHQTSLNVSGGVIEVTKTTKGKFFDGKENNRFEESSTEALTRRRAVGFICSHPYYFSQRRPDLF